jgi:uncharacterized protein (DUF1800 family)
MKTAASILVLVSVLSAFPQADAGNIAANTVQTDTDARITHVLNRLTFGPKSGDFEAIKKQGIGNFINSQLNPSSYQQATQVSSFIAAHPSLNMDPNELFVNYELPLIQAKKESKDKNDPDMRKLARETVIKVINEASEANIRRALFSPRQLEELLTDFWFNHFNISKDKAMDRVLVGHFENNAIRPYALGRFRDLLGATCHHPAMLVYLDNWQNSMPMENERQTGKKGPKLGINENYARELMELHTLGVDGGYTQQDVITLAHILTGLSIPLRRERLNNFEPSRQYYRFYPRRHDSSNKIFLGKRIDGGGEQEIEKALDILVASPATARHISYQLAQYFLADTPPKSIVDTCAQAFQNSGGNIKVVLQTLFASPEFWQPQYAQNKFKSPKRYLISVLRAADIQPTNYEPIFNYLKQAGQPLYGCLTPDGYKNTKEAWLNPDGLVKRISMATSIGSGRLKGAAGQTPNPVRIKYALNHQLKTNTLALFNKTPPGMQAGLLLGSPEFMKY